jgi:hypothetical protein
MLANKYSVLKHHEMMNQKLNEKKKYVELQKQRMKDERGPSGLILDQNQITQKIN